ncbi:uncharacterized protein CC84DRAFT_1210670 [Paraphaeosphaeria sporulosa]|uniref:F-box domain-containing protein n=1 Tax=Paraphaeosphaeria sporulosa TaxID=1460663 RepID=A0A177BU88_9PLEO|nr:uncharacterized protein CC84DRAFT_1210670 [Paraphaeosphaeria sporulosa]OAF98824.1 hypothetical protein CC84DRAFT_1210670 [Paraphaeosphaeria sporulosa]
MALTRARKKRELGSPAPSSDKGQAAKKTKKSTKTNNSKAGSTAPEEKKPKGLMDMPPEIRNRIYHFASEREDFFEGWDFAVPLVDPYAGHSCSQSQWPMSILDRSLSARNFLGLTQTCKLIRKEYRPIWLRNSSIRVRPRYLPLYIHTFYGCATDYSTNMPKSIQISHNQDAPGQDVIDLTLMLRMRAASPDIKFEFIPHELTQDEGLWTLDWSECDICQDLSDTGSDDEDSEMFICPHNDIHREGYADYLLDEEYPYLGALNKFIAHDNLKWLKDIRDRQVTRVKLDLSDGNRYAPEIAIRLSNGSDVVATELSKKSMLGAASAYVEDRDLRSANTHEASLHFMVQVCGGAQ